MTTLSQDRKKLDVEYFKLYGVWKFKKRKSKTLSCIELQINDNPIRSIYQFGYTKFPKNLLFEIRKSTLLGIKDKKQVLFVREHQVHKIDASLWKISRRIDMDKRKWQRMREMYNVHPVYVKETTLSPDNL